MTETEWMNDPALAGFPKEKLVFLETLFTKASSLSQKRNDAFPAFISI